MSLINEVVYGSFVDQTDSYQIFNYVMNKKTNKTWKLRVKHLNLSSVSTSVWNCSDVSDQFDQLKRPITITDIQ